MFLESTSVTFFETSCLHKLNDTTTKLCAIINVPQSNFLKLVYGFGYGDSGIRSSSSLDGTFCFSRGKKEGPTVLPQQLIMIAETYINDAIKYPLEVEFLQAGIFLSKKGAPDDAIEEITLMVPIPAYIALDGFEQEIRT